MRILTILLATIVLIPAANAFEVFDLNVFDQLQGDWKPGFREKRMALVTDYIKKNKPDLVVFQEAKGILPGEKKGGKESVDATDLGKLYPNHVYIYEMTGADGGAYGYWMGSKKAPRAWIEDGFAFPGGVERRTQAAIFGEGKSCLGVLSLHLSYQTSEVRVKEAGWILDWLKAHEKDCKSWLVLGDFNADDDSPEMKALFQGGLKSLYGKNKKPTVGAFNPIRRIYGEKIPSKTIDWALGWNLKGTAKVVLDSPYKGEWASDHAAILVNVNKGEKK